MILLKELQEEIGQLFMVGFEGTTIPKELEDLIHNYSLGGVIYFSRNIQSLTKVKDLSQKLQEMAKGELPLLIAVDEEGGLVRRLKGGVHFPGHMALGATRNCQLAYKAGESMAQQLKSVGINMNLAPVLDVNNNPKNPVIGSRSFGQDPSLVADLGISLMKGMQAQGIITCGKHFPGHGDTHLDSHLTLPIIRHSKERLQKIELYPFQRAIQEGLDSIMTAHVSFPALQPKNLPATLSKAILTGLLRKELSFKGVIISDCMEMDAIILSYGIKEGTIRSIEAGTDMVLISHQVKRQKKAIEGVLQAIGSNRIKEERIYSSLHRIKALKEKIDPITPNFNQGEGHRIARLIAKEGVTLVKDTQSLLPLWKELTCVISFQGEKTLNLKPLTQLLEKKGISIRNHLVKKDTTDLPPLRGLEQVLLFPYRALREKNQVLVVKKLQDQGFNPIIIAIRDPYGLMAFPWVSTYLTTYDPSPHNLVVLGKILLGERRAKGQLPISLSFSS